MLDRHKGCLNYILYGHMSGKLDGKGTRIVKKVKDGEGRRQQAHKDRLKIRTQWHARGCRRIDYHTPLTTLDEFVPEAQTQ